MQLLTPFRIHDLKIKNRVVMAPMETRYANEDGTVTERLIGYLAARARGGVGLVTVEATYVQIAGRYSFNQPGLAEDHHVPGMKALVDRVHEAGARISVQLHHAGIQSRPVYAGRQPVAPSALLSRKGHQLAEAMTLEGIADAVEAFGQAARRAREAGFDAVEIHGAHGYLVNQFLSPFYNKRTDGYGGSLANRLRFPLEVLAAIRRQVGRDFPVLYRMSVEEHTDEGLHLAENVEAAAQLVSAGVDAISVSNGIPEVSGWAISPDEKAKEGVNAPLAQKMKDRVGVPVLVVGKIWSPTVAEGILNAGQADAVVLGRALLADSDWVNKIAVTDGEEPRQCFWCDYCDYHHLGCPLAAFRAGSGEQIYVRQSPKATGHYLASRGLVG